MSRKLSTVLAVLLIGVGGLITGCLDESGLGTKPTADVTPPDAVTNFHADSLDSDHAHFSWTATGDDGREGQAAVYEMLYVSGSVRHDSVWTTATQVPGIGHPRPSGETERAEIAGMRRGQVYTVSLRAVDEAGNWSARSVIGFSYPSEPSLLGACCDSVAGACTLTDQASCHGDWRGGGTSCEPSPCGEDVGACCRADSTFCRMTTESNCSYDWLGANTTCSAQTCRSLDLVGACCRADSTFCIMTTEANCWYDWQGANTTCSAQICEAPPPASMGACCRADSTFCIMTTEANCWYDWLGPNTTCSPTNCDTSWGMSEGRQSRDERGRRVPQPGAVIRSENRVSPMPTGHSRITTVPRRSDSAKGIVLP